MSAALWDDESSPPALRFSPPSAVAPQDDTRSSAELPPSVAAALWRGDALGSPLTQTLATSWPALDQELPGGGWPCRSLTEVLQPQPSVCEWRLLAPVLASTMATGKTAVLVGPPQHPHLPGLRLLGLDERQLVWIQADAPARRLWVTEQLIKSNALGALVAWLPQARQDQIRRLQICAQGCDAPVFLCRPMAAEHEPSAAPLRLQVRYGLDWELQVHVLKRRGATHEGWLTLPSVPGGLASIITPRLMRPSVLVPRRERDTIPESRPHVVGSPASRRPEHGRIAAH